MKITRLKKIMVNNKKKKLSANCKNLLVVLNAMSWHFFFHLLVPFITWQGSLEVNPGILIGSSLVRILPYAPFPWRWS